MLCTSHILLNQFEQGLEKLHNLTTVTVSEKSKCELRLE